jgi:hypothetical protein
MAIILIQVLDLMIVTVIMVFDLKFKKYHNCFIMILDEKHSAQVSRATSKEEMNVDLTPKRNKDFCK